MPHTKTSRGARVALVLIGLGILPLAEAALWLAGAGGARDRSDPFLGFSGEYAIYRPDASGQRLATDAGKQESFNAQSFALAKPAGTLRIFCLGGSSAYGFPRGAGGAFPALLEAKLAGAFPERRFEVINAAGLSYAAYRCVIVAREVARYEPDAIVYYGGDNEYVERRFFGALRDEPSWRRALRSRLNRLRTYTLLKKALLRDKRPEWSGGAGELFGTRVLRDDNEVLPRSAAEDRLIEDGFRASLRQMSEIAREAGALFVIGVPAVNQSDWPPDLSLHDPSKDAGAVARFEVHLGEARRLRAEGQLEAATRELEAAVAIDPSYSVAHFELGACYHALGEADKARAEYEAAITTDATPIRTTPRLQAIARETARATNGIAVDVDALFSAASEEGIIGRRLLVDYCHPNIEGHELIADALFAAIAGPLLQAPGARSPKLDLAAAPDSASAFGIAWEGQMLVRQSRWEEAMEKFREALAIDPGFAYALEGMGRCLAARGDSSGAIAYYERAAAANPENPTILTNLANVYFTTGRLPEAVQALEHVIRVDPNSTNARILLARAFDRMNRKQEARSALEAAVALNPARGDVHRMLAGSLAAAGDLAGAEARYREAIRLDPHDAAAVYSHALVLAQLGRADEALAALDRVIAAQPTFYQAIGAAGIMRMQRGEAAAARALFERVLALHPGDPLATRYLEALRANAPPSAP